MRFKYLLFFALTATINSNTMNQRGPNVVGGLTFTYNSKRKSTPQPGPKPSFPHTTTQPQPPSHPTQAAPSTAPALVPNGSTSTANSDTQSATNAPSAIPPLKIPSPDSSATPALAPNEPANCSTVQSNPLASTETTPTADTQPVQPPTIEALAATPPPPHRPVSPLQRSASPTQPEASLNAPPTEQWPMPSLQYETTQGDQPSTVAIVAGAAWGWMQRKVTGGPSLPAPSPSQWTPLTALDGSHVNVDSDDDRGSGTNYSSSDSEDDDGVLVTDQNTDMVLEFLRTGKFDNSKKKHLTRLCNALEKIDPQSVTRIETELLARTAELTLTQDQDTEKNGLRTEILQLFNTSNRALQTKYDQDGAEFLGKNVHNPQCQQYLQAVLAMLNSKHIMIDNTSTDLRKRIQELEEQRGKMNKNNHVNDTWQPPSNLQEGFAQYTTDHQQVVQHITQVFDLLKAPRT